TKFLFHDYYLDEVLGQLQESYRVLEVNGKRISRYESLYYDTEDFALFHLHRRGKANRFKVRNRLYVESDVCYFELKHKSNKGRTSKNRILRTHPEDAIGPEAEAFLQSKSHLVPAELHPKFLVHYSRITLVNKTAAERVTIDLGLRYEGKSKQESIAHAVIAEVKQDHAFISPFLQLMKKNHFRQASISKYCLGVISLHEEVRHNNFKPALITLKKILHDIPASAF